MILLISLREINKIAGYRGLRASAFGLPWRTAEENKGVQKLAHYGQEFLAEEADAPTSSYSKFRLLAVCNDLHRKFDKSLARGQKTALELEEYARYSEIRSDTVLDPQKVKHYFSLFAPEQKLNEETR